MMRRVRPTNGRNTHLEQTAHTRCRIPVTSANMSGHPSPWPYVFMAAPCPRVPCVVPVLWSVVGGQAVFLLAVPQDLGLVVAGIFGVVLALSSGATTSRASVSSLRRSDPRHPA